MHLIQFLEETGRFTYFAARVSLSLPFCLLRPKTTLRQLYPHLLGSLPLAFVAGAAMGIVVWMHLRAALMQVAGPGALQYLPQALSLAVVLEFAPLGAGLIVAGRSGASLAAELGSMSLTEQVDALTALGQNPLSFLAAPRVLACVIALPLLTIGIDYAAIGSAFGAEWIGGSMTWSLFSRECLRVLGLGQVAAAILKTAVFGWAIGVSGCYFGLEAQGGTEGVGRAATGGVVISVFLVLILDVFLVRLSQFWF
jgi:phospholipid/cholesterol/gamma-HCH transport system permease protein